MKGGRAKPKTGFWVNVQKWSVPEPGGASFVKKPHFDTQLDGWQGGRKSNGGASTSTTVSRKKQTHGAHYSQCVNSLQNHHHHLHCAGW